MCAKLLQSCLTLCDLMDCSPPGSSVHGILHARIRVGCHDLLLGIFLTQGLNPHLLSPALAGGFFTSSTTWEAQQRYYRGNIQFCRAYEEEEQVPRKLGAQGISENFLVGLYWWSSGLKSTFQCRGHEFDLWLGN